MLRLRAPSLVDDPSKLEWQEQRDFFEWAKLVKFWREGLPWRILGDLAFHIPNEGKARGRDSGIIAGMPDICIPVPVSSQARRYNGAYIELKRIGAKPPRQNQIECHARLRAQGYYVGVARGAREAILQTKAYLILEYRYEEIVRCPITNP